MYAQIIIAVICVAIIIAIASVQRDYLYGFWTTDDCDDNDCSSIMLFIGEPEGIFWVTRTCYLIIMDDICSQGMTMKYRQPLLGIYSSGFTADITLDDDPVWPSEASIDVDMTDGSLRVTSDGVMYARLYKSHEITNGARGIVTTDLVD